MRGKYLTLAIVLPGVLLLDQWTKALVVEKFRWGESISLIQNIFSFTYVRNHGAAFGMLRRAPDWFREPFFILVPLVALCVILMVYARMEAGRRWTALALSLILSGAIGNLIDRLRFGYVVDFLDVHWREVYHWPAFNIADSCIVVGVFLMLFIRPYVSKRSSSFS